MGTVDRQIKANYGYPCYSRHTLKPIWKAIPDDDKNFNNVLFVGDTLLFAVK